jgi:hypothetical protein
MKESKPPEKPRTRVKTRKKRSGFVWIFLIIAFAVTAFLLYSYKGPEIVRLLDDKANLTSILPHLKKTSTKSSEDTQYTAPAAPIGKAPPPPAENQDAASQTHIQSLVNDPSLNPTNIDQKDSLKASDSAKKSLKGDTPQQLVDELKAFYTHLDQQPYMLDFQLKEPSKKHFSKLLQVLIDNPPSITRETDDYFTLLKNTAHFFRVLGKDNIFILKGILDREKDSFEKIIKTFYLLTEHPDSLKNEFSLTIPEENLYDYAGFLLNSIGGRLYLFRRDSASRMTISFYAVLVIDKANRKGNSRLGIDLRPSIDSLIEEIENTGKNLKLRDEYLDTLYDLKEYYGNRS